MVLLETLSCLSHKTVKKTFSLTAAPVCLPQSRLRSASWILTKACSRELAASLSPHLRQVPPPPPPPPAVTSDTVLLDQQGRSKPLIAV